jgi:hypothetical protein
MYLWAKNAPNDIKLIATSAAAQNKRSQLFMP